MNNLSHDARCLRREWAQQSLLAFAKAYLHDHIKRYAPSAAHQELYVLLKGILDDRGKRLAIAAPRGFGKSTLVTLVYVLYCIAFKREQFIVLLSATSAQATQLLENTRRELERNIKLREDFPELAAPPPRPWTRSEIETPTHVRVLALGIGQHIRGRKFGKSRPSLVIADDVENRENTASAEAREKLKAWYNQDILKVGAEETNFLFLGTVPHPSCLLAEYLSAEANPSWVKKHYKAVLSEPAHPERWEQWSRIYNNREAFEGAKGPEAARRFYEVSQAAMDEGVQLLWARWSYYDLRIMYEEDPISFYSEMQNSPVNPRECIFDPDSYHYWDDRYKSVEELLSALGDGVRFYGACDPSLGDDTTRGDYTAIIVFAEGKDGVLYVVVADLDRRTPDKTVETILAYHQRYHFTKFGIETNQFQAVIARDLEKRSREMRLRVPIDPLNHARDKVTRIQGLQPHLKSGSIQLCRSDRLLIEQLRYFPRGKYDDGPDALEMVFHIAEESEEFRVFTVGGDSEPWWRDYERNLGWKIF